MHRSSFPQRRSPTVCALAMCALLFCVHGRALAQSDYDKDKARAVALCEQNRFAEALPLLESLYKSNPTDTTVIREAGYRPGRRRSDGDRRGNSR
jgi:hypothetical protein